MSELVPAQLFKHVLKTSACLVFVEGSPCNFIASTLEQSVHILTFDLVVLDIEVLDETDFSIYLW